MIEPPSEKLLAALMKDGAPPKAVAEKLAAYVKIQRDLERCDRDLREEEKRHKSSVNAIKLKRLEIRNACDHPDTTYYPDPSGNNDSYRQCNICGAEL